MILLSIREVRDSIESSAIYLADHCHNKEDAQECYEALKAMARYRQVIDDKKREQLEGLPPVSVGNDGYVDDFNTTPLSR